MPRLVNVARDLRLILWIADDKAVFRAMLRRPDSLRRFAEGLRQPGSLRGFALDIHRKAGLMLGIAGLRDAQIGLLFAHPIELALKNRLLRGITAVAARCVQRQPVLRCARKQRLQGRRRFRPHVNVFGSRFSRRLHIRLHQRHGNRRRFVGLVDQNQQICRVLLRQHIPPCFKHHRRAKRKGGQSL